MWQIARHRRPHASEHLKELSWKYAKTIDVGWTQKVSRKVVSVTLLFFNQCRSLQVSNIIFFFPVCACFIIQYSTISEQIKDLAEADYQCLSAPLSTIATYKTADDPAAKTSAEVAQNTADDMESWIFTYFLNMLA